MKPDKLTIVRNWILDQLESGAVGGGEQLPPTRDIAVATGVSLLIVQSAIESLSNEGALYKVARHGVYVHPEWQERILQRNVFLFDPLYELPYKRLLADLLAEQLPHLRIVSGFKKGVFELRTTAWLQTHHEEYACMSEIFEALKGSTSEFAQAPFRSCLVKGKLMGIPIIYSPWVIYYNPALLEKAGCRMPHADWTWDEFTASLRQLRRTTDGRRLFNWKPEAFLWMNFILRNGGGLIGTGSEDGRVVIDSIPTRDALVKLRAMLRENGIANDPSVDYVREFIQGDIPYVIHPREIMSVFAEAGFRDWKVAPLPLLPGGTDTTIQATDIFCMRKECADVASAKTLARILLSEEFQDFLAERKYGIPVRLSSARKSVDTQCPVDQLFMREMPKMTSNYSLSSSTLFDLVVSGINDILETDCDIDTKTQELASMVRIFKGLEKKAKKRREQKASAKRALAFSEAYHSDHG